MDIQKIKQRFGIIGNSFGLNRAIDVAAQVAPTDLSVLITGESGTGKEVFPQIIHNFSSRKHGKYIPVNCGAIPEGTIDSELFGHEKGSFTGAHDSRQGYFEVADEGTIFLDEVAELPMSTQVRLLRVLESGEFLRVGSSKPQKTNVRLIAATNIDLVKAIEENRFREDLYYRLNTVPIIIPPLKERGGDIYLLFRKFATDFAERYRMPPISLDDEAQQILAKYEWPGNVRQLKNITEQLSVIEENRIINAEVLKKYLPNYYPNKLPALYKNDLVDEKTFATEREILYKFLFDMKGDLNNLKKLVHEIIDKGVSMDHIENADRLIHNINQASSSIINPSGVHQSSVNQVDDSDIEDTEEFIEESLSLEDKEIELIKKALEKHNGKRKYASQDLGISERTLYRKIKEYNID
ncbi:MAG TPA: sigma-54-dependent Fis family transcriptional regulator [Bacteroidales bacterium]|jgi:transcriptional regulator with PAS, ATPase and Fis domain|nr:sigma-54-dependent Fis family transcriptional regulator [Bacteroidales bacterium]